MYIFAWKAVSFSKPHRLPIWTETFGKNNAISISIGLVLGSEKFTTLPLVDSEVAKHRDRDC